MQRRCLRDEEVDEKFKANGGCVADDDWPRMFFSHITEGRFPEAVLSQSAESRRKIPGREASTEEHSRGLRDLKCLRDIQEIQLDRHAYVMRSVRMIKRSRTTAQSRMNHGRKSPSLKKILSILFENEATIKGG